jgi:transglutaminase-like putative cysteine protease
VVAPQIPGVSDDPAGLDRTPPVDEPEPDSPVEVLASYRRTEGIVSPAVVDTVLLRVDIDQPSSGYLTVANLDSYDGAAWRFDRLFTPTGLEVPGAPPSSADIVRQDFEVVEPLPLADQWLPAIDRPVVVAPFTIEGTGASRKVEAVYDPATGMVLSPEPMGAGTRFTIESLPVTSALSNIAVDTPVASSTISAPGETATVLRDPNNIIAGWTAQIGNELASPLVGDVTSLVAMRDWMRDNFGLTDDNIEARLREQGVANPERVVRSLALLSMSEKLLSGDGQGTPEQLATMYVMIARGLGVPARLTTGFRVVDEQSRDSGIPAGSYDITGSDAWTWAEVLVGDEGWVVVDPAPPSDQVVPPPTTTTIPEGSKQEEEIPNEDLTAILPSPVAEPPPPIVTQPPWALIIIGALVLLMLLVFVLAAALRRRLRRRSRRRGDPRQQVVGAWRETLDELTEADLTGLTPLAASEVAAAAAERFGPEVGAPVAGVATLSTPAVFSSNPVDPMNADEAWRNLETARVALRRKLSPRQRLRATVRSLRPRR